MGRRIALVCDWYHPRRGGIETHLDELARRLVAAGHVVRVVTSTPGPPEVNGIPVHRLDVPLVPFAGVAARPVAGAIQRWLQQERIDVVHSHVSIVAPVALAAPVAAQRAGLPTVLTFHSFIPATGLLAGVTGWLLGATRWSAVMTAVSGCVAREVEPFAPTAMFSLLPNAIDTNFWTPGPERDGAPEIRLVYVGRLQSKKRPLLLLRVLRRLQRTAMDRSWRLTVVGSGPLESALRSGVRQLGLDDRVTFVGWTDHTALRTLLRSSDVFLSTAARESFGLAALEARAVGLPVVGVRSSGVADFIEHERSGLLAGDDDAFVSQVGRLVLDERLRARITEFNRTNRVTLDWEHALALHERAYDAAISRMRSVAAPGPKLDADLGHYVDPR